MSKRRTIPRSEEEQRREVEGWRASGQSGASYARSRGYSHSSLTNWAAKVRTATPAPEPRVVRLEVERRRADVVIEIGAARITIASGFDPTLLRQVVVALGGGGT
jgi:hypothetical protein